MKSITKIRLLFSTLVSIFFTILIIILGTSSLSYSGPTIKLVALTDFAIGLAYFMMGCVWLCILTGLVYYITNKLEIGE